MYCCFIQAQNEKQLNELSAAVDVGSDSDSVECFEKIQHIFNTLHSKLQVLYIDIAFEYIDIL